MADWVKLSTNMFDNKKIKQIEVAPKGKQMLLLWVRLICLAGAINDGGKVYVTVGVPYTLEGLAAELNENKSVVKNALELFERYNMIAYEEGCLYLAGWEEHQNIAGLEKIREQTRERVKRYRDNRRNATSNATATDSNSEVTQQNKNKNKNIDYYDDDNNPISYSSLKDEVDTKAIVNTTSLNTTTSLEEEVDSKAVTDNVFLVWQDNISPLTPIIGEKIKALIEECGEDAVLHGISAAVEQNVRTFPYIASCSRNYLGGLKNKKYNNKGETDLAEIAAMIDRRLEESDNGTDSSASFCGFWQP